MIIDTCSSFYDVSLFQSSEDSFVINEQEKSDVKVRTVCFNLNGCIFESCPDRFWKLSENLFVKNKHYSFRDHCDGFAYFNYNDQDYFVWIELKSNFKDVFDKGVFQISSCYVKMKSFFRSFDSLSKKSFREFGIIVSSPENADMDFTNENNSLIESRHISLMGETPKDVIRRRYKKTGKITIDYQDLGNPVSNLHADIVPHHFPIVHIPVSKLHSSVDLQPVISSLFVV